MQEDFLYYVWRNQLFRQKELSIGGSQLKVISPGYRNVYDGPDFKEAHIEIDGLKWHGAVEIHVKASDWYQHGHQTDVNYDAVVLHVVYENDKAVFTTSGEEIPALALKGLIKPKLFDRYQRLIENPSHVPCGTRLDEVPAIKRLSMLERVLVERLERKSALILEELALTKNNWQEVTFRMLAKSMGFKANDEPMLNLARSVDFKWLLKAKSIQEKEALLLGIGGFLNGTFQDEYVIELQETFAFLKSKYRSINELDLTQWKFAPLRPQNQPVQRIVQLAALLHHFNNLWELFFRGLNAKELYQVMSVPLSDYWQHHIRPDREITKPIKQVSFNTVTHLLINLTAPLLVAYSLDQDDRKYMDKATNLLTQLKAEQNRITRLWAGLNWNAGSAFDSQGLNELYQQFCQAKKCLDCHVGVHLLNGDS